MLREGRRERCLCNKYSFLAMPGGFLFPTLKRGTQLLIIREWYDLVAMPNCRSLGHKRVFAQTVVQVVKVGSRRGILQVLGRWKVKFRDCSRKVNFLLAMQKVMKDAAKT